MYPTGILRNTETGRYHPISFRIAPMPNFTDDKLGTKRYRSLGHHTEGFATEEEAVAFVEANKEMRLVNVVWEWNPKEMPVPAMTEWFRDEEAPGVKP